VTLRPALQHLELRWGKEARGTDSGNRAAERNAVPRSFAFSPPGAREQGWFQHVLFESGAHFVPVERWFQLGETAPEMLPLRWRRDGDHHWIGCRNLFLQKPSRPNLEGWFARLPIGQRLIFRVNTAIDWENSRDYREHHLIIGWSDDGSIDLPTFRDIDERALLY
jgi:hypothetical protein